MNRKTAIVTGGSRGIGKAVVELLSQSGYNVIFSYRQSEREARMVAENILKNGGEAAAVAADCATIGGAQLLTDICLSRYGRIDLLVNNAGIAARKLLTDMSGEEIRAVTDTNLLGVIYACRAAAPQMVRQKSGAVVNVSSVQGVSGASMEAVYSAAKAGVIGFSKAFAKELAPSGVTVNCIAPGVTDTDMNRFLNEEERVVLRNDIPLARFGTAGEMAAGILFLAEHPYITGQLLAVDGGMT